jgi:hypothetical protein
MVCFAGVADIALVTGLLRLQLTGTIGGGGEQLVHFSEQA